MRAQRILHVYKDFAPRRGGGGVARHIDGLATLCAQLGYEVRVAAPLPDAGDGDETYAIARADTLALWRHIGWADTVHVHGARTPISAFAALLARLRGKRLIYTPHCYYESASRRERFLKACWDRLAERFLLRRSDAVVLLSDFWLQYLRRRGLAPTTPVLLPNCVLEARMQSAVGIPLAGAPAVLSVGRLDAVKRIDDTIRALAAPGLERAVLHVVGTGPDRERLEQVAAAACLASRVCFHGFVDDGAVAGMAAAADVFAISSAVEGMPTTIIEMLLLGCPVVASDIPGNRAILADVGLEDALYPLGDVARLAASIRLHSARELPAAIAARTRAGFTWEGVQARIAALYGAHSMENDL